MQNKLVDLNNYLFEALERITDDELTDEELKKELQRAKSVSTLATNIINNGELALKTMNFCEDRGIEMSDDDLPPMMKFMEAKPKP